ncbi:sensor histidine kinase [Actinomadura algeriensis]|uniref:histidine kinase n=1 Tax=Actinomadura algeriensis TaxID=1679523 RepID=A0ABR9JY64_9ACTN|nr:nitrate- and nitrite sensing domain-containing protein [Actinomadura algeriensis]MBE1535517.1 signal transduction histidine kinase [Actinomadura algeriensis]
MTQPHGSRARLRARPIRRRIALLLAVPLASLLALWAFAGATTLSDARQRLAFATVRDEVGEPAGFLTQALQGERTAAVAFLAGGGAGANEFRERVAATDQSVAAFQEMANSPDLPEADGTLPRRLRAISESFAGLRDLRSRIEAGSIDPLAVIDGYSAVVDDTMRLVAALASIGDVSIYQHTHALLQSYWSLDFMLREDALLRAVHAGGRMGAAERTAFAGWAAEGRLLFENARTGLDGEAARLVREFADSEPCTAYRQMEDGVVRAGTVPSAGEWRATVDAALPPWQKAAEEAGIALQTEEVDPAGQRIMLRFYLAGGLGLLAVAVSVALSLLFARRIADELRNLQRTAQRLAHERLPSVVARLRRGEKVDVDAETPRAAVGRTTEIVLVGEAFDAVQRTAIGTAVGEAELRENINRVFVSLSWRSQSLLQRQLRLLDQMERGASSPEELENLFRLDHLTTRMRRHAEGLVILSGSPTVRAWDQPVDAEDVARAAIAEVEDYTRVEVAAVSSGAVHGAVVADVIHLLAELIENATAYSPPSTEVTVKIERVANGLAAEVIDRGVGLHPDEMAELNRRLAEAVEFDLADDTDRLGLFVVSRLASRHGIRVVLQPSPYGGTTAVVLLPNGLIASGEAADLPPVAAEPPPVEAPHRFGRRLDRPRRPAVTAPPEPEAAPSTREAPSVTGPPSVFEPPPRREPAPEPMPEPVPEPMGAPVHEPSARQGEPAPGEPEPSETTGRLPKRVRQRSLAPQLRGRPQGRHAAGASAPEAAAEPADDDEPDPESSRALMASLQSGWTRGREEDEPGVPGDAAEDDPRNGWRRS